MSGVATCDAKGECVVDDVALCVVGAEIDNVVGDTPCSNVGVVVPRRNYPSSIKPSVSPPFVDAWLGFESRTNSSVVEVSLWRPASFYGIRNGSIRQTGHGLIGCRLPLVGL